MSTRRGWWPSKAVYGPGRIELHRVEALLDVERGALGREVGVVVDVPRPHVLGVDAAAVRVEVGVGAQRLVHLAAEQLVDRLAGLLADDVPAGHLQRRDAAHHRDVRALGESGRIGAAEEGLDVVRIAPDEIALGAVLDHARRDVRAEGGIVGLAIADDAAVGDDLDEDEILAADAGGRVADNPGLDVGDLHDACSRSRRSSFTPPSGLPAISPTRGEMASSKVVARLATSAIGENKDEGRSPPVWGRWPAGQRGAP